MPPLLSAVAEELDMDSTALRVRGQLLFGGLAALGRDESRPPLLDDSSHNPCGLIDAPDSASLYVLSPPNSARLCSLVAFLTYLAEARPQFHAAVKWIIKAQGFIGPLDKTESSYMVLPSCREVQLGPGGTGE